MTDAPLDLLPPNATPLERAVSRVDARLLTLPTEMVRQIRNPATCPEALLPYLAIERGVREWDSSWPAETKRAVIAASYDVHRLAGTAGAMERALAAIDVDISLREWFTYGGQPYRFRARWTLEPGAGFEVAAGRQVIRVARQTKNVRSRLERLEVAASGPSAPVHVGCVTRSRIRFRPLAA